MRDFLSCGECGSRRLSGTPESGFFCHDCGRHSRADFDNDEAHGNATEHGDGFWGTPDLRFDDSAEPWQGEEADGGRQTADSSGSGSAPRAPSPEPRAPSFPLLTDPHSHLRCACCFELAARCRRLRDHSIRERCCVACRCGE